MEFAELIKTPRVDGVVLHRPFMPVVEGTLCLTGHHLILSSRQDNTEELWLLHANIDAIEKRQAKLHLLSYFIPRFLGELYIV